MNASSTAAAAPGGSAAETTASASLTQLSKTAKHGKAAGKKGLASALQPTAAKGKGTFFSLLNAKAATKDGAHDTAASLKTLAAKAAATGGKMPSLDGLIPPGVDPESDAAKNGASRDEKAAEKSSAEKAAGKKKAAHTQTLTLAALAVPAGASDAPKAHALKGKPATADPSPDLKPAAARPASQTPEPALRIVDLRTRARQASPEDAAAAKIAAQPATADKDAGATLVQKPGPAREIALPDRAPPSAAPSLTQTPLDRLRDMAGSELLKATNLVLRDGGGEIRLVLKPESLGSVRIRMNVVDNSIEGRIIVDSSSVKLVIDAGMDALRRALTAEGFHTGSLQVSVGGQNTEADARREQQPSETVRRISARGFERNVPGLESMSLGDQLVNLFV